MALNDILKQMSSVGIESYVKSANVPTEPNNAASLTTTQSPYKFEDWVKAQGYTYDKNTNQLNAINLPSEITSNLEDGYASEQVYNNIINSYFDLLKKSQQEQQMLDTTAQQQGGQAETGEYKSPYEEQMQSILDEFKQITPYKSPEELNEYLKNLLISANEPFTYDPTKDQALKNAQKEVGRQVMEQAGSRGMLYSSGTISRTAGAQGALIPQYEAKAYQRYSDQKNREMNMFSTLLKWDQMQSDRYQDQIDLVKTKFDYLLKLDSQNFEKFQLMLDQRNQDREYQLKVQAQELERQVQDINDAYRRVEAIGYVDNKTAIVLGLPVGTKAQWVKELELSQKQEMDRMQKEFDKKVELQKSQAKIEKDLINYKNSLEEAQKKKLMQEQFQYDKKLADYEHKLAMGRTPASSTDIITSAKSLLGLKYVWGGTSPTTGMDCSGFTQWVFKQHGVQLPRLGRYQATSGVYVPKDQLQPGDLVFFNTYRVNGHVGIYTGNGEFIHAGSNGKGVQMDKLSRWGDKYSTGRRITGKGKISYDTNINNYGPNFGSSERGTASTRGYTGKDYKAGDIGRNWSGQSTLKVQKALNRLGFNVKETGKYDVWTTLAVANFQRFFGLKPDGWFGTTSLKKMKSLAFTKGIF